MDKCNASVCQDFILKGEKKIEIIKREHKLDLTTHPSVMEIKKMLLLCFSFFMSLLLVPIQ